MPPDADLLVRVAPPLPRITRWSAKQARLLGTPGCCGLDHRFSSRSWPRMVRLIWWALRDRNAG